MRAHKIACTNAGEHMPDLRPNPPGDSERESLIVTLILRTGLVLISAFICVLLFVLGYELTSYIFGVTDLFDEYPTEYLLLSIACGAAVGIFLPFESFGRIFENLIETITAPKQAIATRVLISLITFLVFIIVYWYFLTIVIAIGSAVIDLI